MHACHTVMVRCSESLAAPGCIDCLLLFEMKIVHIFYREHTSAHLSAQLFTKINILGIKCGLYITLLFIFYHFYQCIDVIIYNILYDMILHYYIIEL